MHWWSGIMQHLQQCRDASLASQKGCVLLDRLHDIRATGVHAKTVVGATCAHAAPAAEDLSQAYQAVSQMMCLKKDD